MVAHRARRVRPRRLLRDRHRRRNRHRRQARDTHLLTVGGRFYPQFDAVVLLSAPADVLLRLIALRTTNHFGKATKNAKQSSRYLAEVEPLLRETCSHEFDATQPIGLVVEKLIAISAEP